VSRRGRGRQPIRQAATSTVLSLSQPFTAHASKDDINFDFDISASVRHHGVFADSGNHILDSILGHLSC
jgi:hypothetical protein